MKKIHWNIIVLILLLGVCVVWICYSRTNPKEYLSAPVHSIITIAFGLLVSYYLVQKKTDRRKKYELAEKLIEQTKCKVADLLTLLYNEEISVGPVFVLKRAVTNKLDNCDNIDLNKSTKAKLKDCIEAAKELNDIIEDMHVAGGELTNKINNKKQDIIRIMGNIEYRCDKVLVDLWMS